MLPAKLSSQGWIGIVHGGYCEQEMVMKVLFCMVFLALAWTASIGEASAATKRGRHIETNVRFYDRAVSQIAGPKATRAASYFAYLKVSGS